MSSALFWAVALATGYVFFVRNTRNETILYARSCLRRVIQALIVGPALVFFLVGAVGSGFDADTLAEPMVRATTFGPSAEPAPIVRDNERRILASSPNSRAELVDALGGEIRTFYFLGVVASVISQLLQQLSRRPATRKAPPTGAKEGPH